MLLKVGSPNISGYLNHYSLTSVTVQTAKKPSTLKKLFCCLSIGDDVADSKPSALTLSSLNRPSLQATRSTNNNSQAVNSNAENGEKKSGNDSLQSTPLISGTHGDGDSRLFDGRWSPSNTSNVYNKKQKTPKAAGKETIKSKSSKGSLNDSSSEKDKGEEGELNEGQVLSSSQPGEENTVLPDALHLPTDESKWLLGPVSKDLKGRKCLVLDLDETLVHSSFKYIHQADFVIPVEIESHYYNVYVIKRPGVDEFMKRVGELYEVVVFTASVSKYGDPLLDQLDINHVIHHRLFRESCYNYNGNYIKNLAQLGRPLEDVIIIDNSPGSYILHPQHAVPISSWFSDIHDNELLDMVPFLEDLAKKDVRDVSLVLDMNVS